MKAGQLKNYYGSIDFSVENNSHTQAFLFLREHCLTHDIACPKVLEIGCSNGYFSAALQEHGAWIYGVEPFTREAEVTGRVDDFFYGTVEAFCREASVALQRQFDAVILGDVLEHLVDPEGILHELGVFLRDTGVIIASVPNITHIGMRRMLEERQWMYQKYGLLDSTHVRFFSWNSLRTLFLRTGFGIERRFTVLVPEFQVHPSVEAAERMIKNEPLTPAEHTFQFIIRASRKAFSCDTFADSFPEKILVLSQARHILQAEARFRKGLAACANAAGKGILHIKETAQCHKKDLDQADLLILYKEASLHCLDIIRYARELGLAIVYDLDELVLQPPPWGGRRITHMEKLLVEHIISTATCVTCPTEAFRNELQKLTDEVVVVPDAILAPGEPPDPCLKHYGEACTLIVDMADAVCVEALVRPVVALCAALPEMVVVTLGPKTAAFAKIGSRVKQYGLCSAQQAASILAAIDNGIGLIPLDESLYAACKSPVQFTRYTAYGIVTVASAVPPYSSCLTNGVDGVLVDNTVQGWCAAVVRLAVNCKRRQELLANAQESSRWTASQECNTAAWEQVVRRLPKPTAKSGLAAYRQ